MKIGSYQLPGTVIAAPMAGVTDLPYRRLCRRFGAALTVSEMVHADPALRHGSKSQWRTNHTDEPAPVVAQLLGTEPGMLAEAARYNVDRGAHIIDINMGCPAKKVCNKQAGSALLADESRVARILEAVVRAVAVPVTVKIRTGLEPSRRNGVRVARLAEQADAMLEHVEALYEFYGEHTGVRTARKHICWYTRTLKNGDTFWKSINRLETAKAQKQTLKSFLQQQSQIPQAA